MNKLEHEDITVGMRFFISTWGTLELIHKGTLPKPVYVLVKQLYRNEIFSVDYRTLKSMVYLGLSTDPIPEKDKT